MSGAGAGRTSRRIVAEPRIVSGLDLRVANANTVPRRVPQELLIPTRMGRGLKVLVHLSN